MSRLEVLEASLARKRARVDAMIEGHFADVRSANGQPLNDKKCGATTMRRWGRQSDAIRTLMEGIERTERAIERERNAIARVEALSADLPPPVLDRLASGLLIQWRKHPRTFFVSGVDKARIVLLDDGRVAHRYAVAIKEPDQRKLFAQTFNALSREVVAILEAQE